MTPDDRNIAAELDQRLAHRLVAAQERRQRDRDTRSEFAVRRNAGKATRHASRLKETQMPTTANHIARRTDDNPYLGPDNDPERLVRCRYLRRNDEMCSAEVLDPTADVLICAKHAGRVMALIRSRMAGGQ